MNDPTPEPGYRGPVSEQDLDDLNGLITDFGEHWYISHRLNGWRASPIPREQDVITAADPDSLRGKLDREMARREVSDL